MKFTQEQSEIISANIHPGQSLVVDAFAGSGKTSTLVAYAGARPGTRFIYLAFNRAIKDEAQSRFPSNVRCVTMHGLAYGQFGAPYQHKIETGRLREALVANLFKCSPLVARAAMETLGAFLCSSDSEIGEKHLSRNCLPGDEVLVLDVTADMWLRMMDLDDKDVPMLHDGYLKLYQLSNPLIRADVIMIDEFQDSNAVVVDIVSRQSASKIYVGDENQAIYGFRGALNALGCVRADKRMSLTSSFRFGSGIAALSTLLLRDWKGEMRAIHGLGGQATVFHVNEVMPHAKIGRTNSGLFNAAASLVDDRVPFGFVGGTNGCRLDLIQDAYSLKTGQGSVTDPFLSAFPCFDAMVEYANAIDDKELKMLSRLVNDYGGDIPHYVGSIRSQAAGSLTGSEVALMTAHKSKGLEFDSVALLDDFADLEIDPGAIGSDAFPDDEEINLLYVAATRSKRCLKLTASMSKWVSDLEMWDSVLNGDVGSFVGKKGRLARGLEFSTPPSCFNPVCHEPIRISARGASGRKEARRPRTLKPESVVLP